ncbi:MAG TPA: PQQ-binding-like beta-propeller repeat protein, partial [Thermoanaerobaculia bacterium]
AELGGVRQAVVLTREGAVGVGVADGAVKWTYAFRSRERYSANAASPVVVGDTVLLSAAYQTGSALLRIDAKGATEVWRNMALGAHWSTPIAHEGHVYGFDGRHEHEATLRCVRWSDGKVLWQKDGYERGSMLRADGRWILLSEDGRLVLADLSPEGAKEISSVRAFPGPHCWAAPVLSRGLLYLAQFDHGRQKARLSCLDLRGK